MTHVSCDYNQDKQLPWSCDFDHERNLAVKEILSEYPNEITLGHAFISMSVPVSCKFDKSDAVIRCGTDHSLRVSDKGEFIVIKKMENMIMGQTFVDNKFNPLLWAKTIDSSFKDMPFSFKVDADILTADERVRVKNNEDLRKLSVHQGLVIHDVQLYHTLKKPTKGFGEEYKFKTGKMRTGVSIEKSTIHPDYQKKWSLFEALREWIANAHDVTKEVQDTKFYKDADGNWVIEYDTDAVLMLKHLLVLGTHEDKKGKLTIGQFGEGITLGCLVLARLGIPVKIEAIGKTYYPELLHNEIFETELLHAYYKENLKTYGTKITFIGIPDEIMEEAKHTFLFNRVGEYDILHEHETEGKLIEFHDMKKRVAVRDLIISGPKAKALKQYFSYNFYDKDEILVNRDRDIVSSYDLRTKMKEILKTLSKDNKPLIEEILSAYAERKSEKYDDLNQYITPEPKVIDDWKEILQQFLKDKYGTTKVAIKSEFKWANENVQNMGYELLDWGDNGRHLLEYLEYKSSDDIEGAEGKPNVMPLTKLSAEKQRNFFRAIGNVRAILEEYYHETSPDDQLHNIFVAETFEGCKERAEHNKYEDCGTDILKGMRRDEKIYIHQSQLVNPATATGTLLHETLHRYKEVDDASRRFENELTGVSGFTTNEWTGHRELFKKSIDVLKDNKRYIPSGALETKYPEMLHYLE